MRKSRSKRVRPGTVSELRCVFVRAGVDVAGATYQCSSGYTSPGQAWVCLDGPVVSIDCTFVSIRGQGSDVREGDARTMNHDLSLLTQVREEGREAGTLLGHAGRNVSGSNSVFSHAVDTGLSLPVPGWYFNFGCGQAKACTGLSVCQREACDGLAVGIFRNERTLEMIGRSHFTWGRSSGTCLAGERGGGPTGGRPRELPRWYFVKSGLVDQSDGAYVTDEPVERLVGMVGAGVSVAGSRLTNEQGDARLCHGVR